MLIDIHIIAGTKQEVLNPEKRAQKERVLVEKQTESAINNVILLKTYPKTRQHKQHYCV